MPLTPAREWRIKGKPRANLLRYEALAPRLLQGDRSISAGDPLVTGSHMNLLSLSSPERHGRPSTPSRGGPLAVGAGAVLSLLFAGVPTASAQFGPLIIGQRAGVAQQQQQQAAPAPADATDEPPLPKLPLADVCELRVTDGRLQFSTRIPFMSRWMRPVEIPELPGTSELSYQRYRFQLRNEHQDADGNRIILSVERSRTNSELTISRRILGSDADQSLTLRQQYEDDNMSRARPGRIHLTVSVDNKVIADEDAPDIQTLRREHPRPFYKYALPALKELRAQGVMGIDPWAARQALADRLPTDQVPAAVRRLVGELGSPSARVRERATCNLAGLGEDGMAALKDLDRAGLAPQQVMAIDALLERFKPLPRAESDRLRNDADFLFDCLYSEEPDVSAAALARLRQLNRGEKLQPDLSVPPEARGPAIEALRLRLAPEPATQPSTAPDK
jgi:hypothetical protein